MKFIVNIKGMLSTLGPSYKLYELSIKEKTLDVIKLFNPLNFLSIYLLILFGVL